MQAMFVKIFSNVIKWALGALSSWAVKKYLKEKSNRDLKEKAQKEASKITDLVEKIEALESSIESLDIIADKVKIEEIKNEIKILEKQLREAGIASNTDFIK